MVRPKPGARSVEQANPFVENVPMQPTVTPPSPVGARAAFAVVLGLVGIGYLTQSLVSEPFPALTQPAFSYSAGALPAPSVVPGEYASVEVRFADGSRAIYFDEELLPWTAGIPRSIIFAEAILDRQPIAPETAAWLVDRIATLTEAVPVEATIRIHSTEVSARTLERVSDTVKRELVLSLDAAW